MVEYKKCPFKYDKCNEECALFIDPQTLNEFVVSKLASIGILDRKEGFCSLKVIGLANLRYIFENTTINRL